MKFFIRNPKVLFLKVASIFTPVYLVAFFTQNMVYVLPTLAVGIFLGSNIQVDPKEDPDVEEAESDASD